MNIDLLIDRSASPAQDVALQEMTLQSTLARQVKRAGCRRRLRSEQRIRN